MKKLLLPLLLFACTLTYAQELPKTLSLAVKNTNNYQLSSELDFSYYTKNFNKAFGRYNLTSDILNYKERDVYVGFDTFHFGDEHRPLHINMPQPGATIGGCPSGEVFGMGFF